jgi:dipeptidyl aminopeptidase/acylaminoacyl peptidase
MDVWLQPVTGGQARQITRVTGRIRTFAFSPSEDVLLYEADARGDELTHLFLTDITGSAHRDLTPDLPDGGRALFVGWAEEGESFLYQSNVRDRRFFDLYEYTLITGRSELLWQSDANLQLSLADRSQRLFVVTEILSDIDRNLYLMSRGSGDLTLLTPHEGEASFIPTAFSKDGATLYFTSDDRREFKALFALDLETRRARLFKSAEWDLESGFFSDGWSYFVTRINVAGKPQIDIREVQSGRPIDPPLPHELGAFVPISFSRSDRYMGALLVTDTVPETLYVADLQRGEWHRPLDVLPEELRNHRMVVGESVSIPSFDGREVPAILYRPAGSGPFPAVISVHGGPTQQASLEFRPLCQYLASKGYAVLRPNVRGSTGFGKTYTRLDNLDLGGGPLRDVISCKRWLVAEANVDPESVVVLGASYGGYMALAAATFTPGEFAGHVVYFGFADLRQFVEGVPPYWTTLATYLHKKFGDPDNPRHASYQYERSPVHFVDRVTAPILMVQGENDPRARREQSDQMVAELRDHGVPVDYLVISGEGHGFSSTENVLKAYTATDRFLDRHLLGDESVKVLQEV